MESLSPYLTTEPKPLIGLISKLENEPDILQRFQSAVDGILPSVDNPESLPNFSYRILSKTHEFKMKKDLKTNLQYDGILKRDWLRKHRELMPSVVVSIWPFNTDWKLSDWSSQENIIEDSFKRMRTCLESRDARIVLLLVRIGVNVLDKESLDERLASIKRKLQLDSSKFVYLTSSSEINYQNQSLKKIVKSIREYSLNYYNSHFKRCKQIIKTFPVSLSPLDALVVARYNFKTAFYSEVLGQKPVALRHYYACFALLVEQYHLLGLEWIDQLKAVCEWCNFKICASLLTSNNLKDAGIQFRSHTQQFYDCVSLCDWRHYHWMSNQYIIFNQLLDLSNVDANSGDADRGYYYFAAAKYSSQRFQAIHDAKATFATSNIYAPIRAKFADLVSSVSRFIGAPPEMKDPNLSQQSPTREELDKLVYAHYLENKDENASISKYTRDLITTAISYIPQTQVRRLSSAYSLLGNVMVLEEQYADALPIFINLSDEMACSKWSDAALSHLQTRMKCAKHIGDLKGYLIGALILYSSSSRALIPILSSDKKNQLDRDVMGVLTSCQGCETAESFGQDCVVNSPDFGRFLSQESSTAISQPSLIATPSLKYIPGGIILEMSGRMSMFDVKVRFFCKTMNIGSSVRLSLQIKSSFVSTIKCKKMVVHFFDESITKCFIDDGQSSIRSGVDSCDSAPQIAAGLEFQCNEFVEFIFDVFVPETYMQNISGDTFFGAQYVTLELANEYASDPNAGGGAGDRNVVFKLPHASKNVIQKLENKGKPIKTQDFLNLFHLPKESVIQVAKPKATVEMIYPLSPSRSGSSVSKDGSAGVANISTIAASVAGGSGADASVLNLLQGPIQRVNLIFKTNDDYIFSGRFYLSSDLISKVPTDSLFWYPELDSASEAIASPSLSDTDADPLVDRVRFNPFLLNSSFQPSQPLLIPNQTPGSYFYIPIFVRSEQVGTFKLRFRMEYISKRGFSTFVSREYETKVQFHRGLQLNYSFMSKRLANCGVGKETGASSYIGTSSMPGSSLNPSSGALIVKGDSVSMNVALKSLETLDSSIEITDYFVNHAENILQEGDWISNENFPPFFAFGDDKNSVFDANGNKSDKIRNLYKSKMLGSSNNIFSLKKDEVFVGNVVLNSMNDLDKYKSAFENRKLDEYDSSSTHTNGVKVSFGETLVNWRIKDSCFLKPLDLSPLTSLVTIIDNSRSSSSSTSSNNSISISRDSSSDLPVDFSWIPTVARLGVEGAPPGATEHALIKSISFFRLCSSLFSLPPIEVVHAPFEIFPEVPTSATVGEEIQVVFHIFNRMFSTERIMVTCSLQQDMLLTGATNVIIDVPIQAWSRVKIAMVPIKCGQIPLPNISLLWERYLNPHLSNLPPQSIGSPLSSSVKSPGEGDSRGPSPTNLGSSGGFSGLGTQGANADSSRSQNAILVEIGFPSDLRYIFVNPCDINY